MLETLYGCGLRVVVSLKISDLFFEEGFIKITGKGTALCSYWKLGSEIHPYL
jgi:site-specific recombinase XerD